MVVMMSKQAYFCNLPVSTQKATHDRKPAKKELNGNDPTNSKCISCNTSSQQSQAGCASVVIVLSCSKNTSGVRQLHELTLACTSPVQTAYTKKQSSTYNDHAG